MKTKEDFINDFAVKTPFTLDEVRFTWHRAESILGKRSGSISDIKLLVENVLHYAKRYGVDHLTTLQHLEDDLQKGYGITLYEIRHQMETKNGFALL